MSTAPVFYGEEAVREVERLEGPLNNIERSLVHHEGYVPGDYKDDKGISTAGVGQTGKFKGMRFKDVASTFVNETRRYIPDYDLLPEPVKEGLVSLAYRGDLQQSPTFRKLIAKGDYVAASKELLNHKEYKARKKKRKPDGVVRRLEEISSTIRKYGEALQKTQGNN